MWILSFNYLKKKCTALCSLNVENCCITSRTVVTFGDKSRLGRGGMTAKVNAAVCAAYAGTPVIITSGYATNSIIRVLQGERIGTVFHKDAHLWTNMKEVSAHEMAVAAHDGSRQLQVLNSEERRKILLTMADALEKNESVIRLENEADLADKLILEKISCPLGVLLVIFESRPDALVQIAALAIRSGNGLLLKGGKEARRSNAVLHKVITSVMPDTVGDKLIGLVTSREEIPDLLKILWSLEAVTSLFLKLRIQQKILFLVMLMEFVMCMLTSLLILIWQSRLLGMQRLIILQPAMQWKRTAGEIGSIISNRTHPGKLKTPKVLKQDEIKNRQAFHGDSSESHEQCTEAVAAFLSSNPTTVDASITHKVKLFSLLLLDRVLEADLCSDSKFFF